MTPDPKDPIEMLRYELRMELQRYCKEAIREAVEAAIEDVQGAIAKAVSELPEPAPGVKLPAQVVARLREENKALEAQVKELRAAEQRARRTAGILKVQVDTLLEAAEQGFREVADEEWTEDMGPEDALEGINVLLQRRKAQFSASHQRCPREVPQEQGDPALGETTVDAMPLQETLKPPQNRKTHCAFPVQIVEDLYSALGENGFHPAESSNPDLQLSLDCHAAEGILRRVRKVQKNYQKEKRTVEQLRESIRAGKEHHQNVSNMLHADKTALLQQIEELKAALASAPKEERAPGDICGCRATCFCTYGVCDC